MSLVAARVSLPSGWGYRTLAGLPRGNRGKPYKIYENFKSILKFIEFKEATVDFLLLPAVLGTL